MSVVTAALKTMKTVTIPWGRQEPPQWRAQPSARSVSPEFLRPITPASDGDSEAPIPEGRPMRPARTFHPRSNEASADLTDVLAVRSLVDELFFAWLLQQDESRILYRNRSIPKPRYRNFKRVLWWPCNDYTVETSGPLYILLYLLSTYIQRCFIQILDTANAV